MFCVSSCLFYFLIVKVASMMVSVSLFWQPATFDG